MSTRGASVTGSARAAERKARQAATDPWVVLLARAGYAARGVVYGIIGLLAAKAALGHGSAEAGDRKEAILTIYHQPFGQFLLIIVAIGLFGYALWGAVRAIFDVAGKGADAKGLAARLGYAGSAVSYAALAVAALGLVLGSGNGGKSSNQSAHDWTGQLLTHPFGAILVILAGLVVLALAAIQFGRAVKAGFKKHLEQGRMSARERQVVEVIGRFGYAARGVVFGEIGVFLIIAALRKNADKTLGLGGALQELARQPFGPLVLGIVAVGLIAFGILSFAEARYRHIGPSSA